MASGEHKGWCERAWLVENIRDGVRGVASEGHKECDLLKFHFAVVVINFLS